MRLNLGCGDAKLEGWVNVDRILTFEPDVVHDLEQTPWPFDDDSCSEVLLNHVLEHVGRATDVFLAIMKELYRVCEAGATVRTHVPHPHHDDFINDPAHVRPITPETLAMFDRDINEEWQKNNIANTRLAMYTGTDFKITDTQATPDPRFLGEDGKLSVTFEALLEIARIELNVIKEFRITLVVRK